VRVRTEGGRAFLSVKGETRGATRAEYEYAIPLADAERMLDALCERPLIEKRRYRIEHSGLVFEVDEFLGENAGLVVAEVELEREDQALDLPAWVGREVTGDPRYFNSNLVRRPYRAWGAEPERG
jgi:adenylate cyclase